jgi:hypothetical protein
LDSTTSVTEILIEEADNKLLIEFIELTMWLMFCNFDANFFPLFYSYSTAKRIYTDIGHWYINTNGRWTERENCYNVDKKIIFWHSELKSNEISRFITQLILSDAAKEKNVKNNKHKSYCCEWMNWDVFLLSQGFSWMKGYVNFTD